MTIGSLGGILFSVSAQSIQTISKLEHSGSAKIQNHELHLRKALPEFTGSEPEKITIQIRVSAALGGNPAAEIEKIRSYTEQGAVLPQRMGTRRVSGGSWMIASFKVSWQDTDRYGNVTDADITLTLQEYPR